VIVFIPRSGDGCKPGNYDTEWLPRQCPACHEIAIIGHGRRRRPAHDPIHDWIWVRRGICKVCEQTLTVLPGWCVPHSRYSLLARQPAIDQLCQGWSAEEAAPECREPDRFPDGSTVRRWFRRFRLGLRLLALPPTLLAWDWGTASRILTTETNSP
jgi:Domain of unknown function (DUF6431)